MRDNGVQAGSPHRDHLHIPGADEQDLHAAGARGGGRTRSPLVHPSSCSQQYQIVVVCY